MNKNYLALSPQTVRYAADGVPSYLFYPVTGGVDPTVDYKENPVKEWRALDTSQGDISDERTSSSWKYSLDGRIYPGAELNLLLKHLFGYAVGANVITDAPGSASSYIFLTDPDMYGEGTQRVDNAIAVIPNTSIGNTIYRQEYLGGRIRRGEFTFKGGEAAMMKLDFYGGPWIGAAGQTATAGVSFPAQKAFRSVPTIYLGSGASITGTLPFYTGFEPGTMAQVSPDDLTITIDNGMEDIYKMNGVAGPSVTERVQQWSITAEFTVDFTDPSSGWSSYDAWVAQFNDMAYGAFLMKLLSQDHVFNCPNLYYTFKLYVPKMKVTVQPPDRKHDGSKNKIKVKMESRIDPAVGAAAFAQLLI
jgi:hypothetical protein